MKNIALMATAGASGKDTVAEIIQEMTNQQYVKTPLSGQIHELCNKMYFRGDRKVVGRVPREYLHSVGEFIRATFGETTWIDLTDEKLIEIEKAGKSSIITDVRKVTEYAHYCVEGDCLPLYIMSPMEQIRNRLMARDGEFTEELLHSNLETQMRFIETLPRISVGNHGLKRVEMEYCSHLDNIYILDNSTNIKELEDQIKEWWGIVNGN